MTGLQALVLGIVQGLTEFIPVSSSGHLILLRHLMGVKESGLVFDVALHLGTFLALLTVFYRDVWELLMGLLGRNDKRRLALLILVATLPAVIAGILLESAAESAFRSVKLVSIDLMIVAVLMIAAERYAAARKKRTKLGSTEISQALSIGMAQAVAIVPGVSRSGATITAGLFSGMDRVAATRFSFLLALPITAGAIIKVSLRDDGMLLVQNDPGTFIIGISTAFISGLIAIKFLLSYLSRHSLAVFAYYRIALGIVAVTGISFF